MATIRRNISMDDKTYQLIMQHAKRTGKSVSETMSTYTLEGIRRREQADLRTYLLANVPVADAQELEELTHLCDTIDWSDEGEAWSVDELLRG